MIKGFYSAASGMVAQMYRQQVIAHNLANVTTTGYKADRLTLESFPGIVTDEPRLVMARLEGIPASDTAQVGAGVMPEDRPFDLREGDLRQTTQELDLALTGPGFFCLQTPNGTTYTRNGSFHRSGEGILCNADGYPVLGQNGPIQLGIGPVVITPEGAVVQNGTEVGRLALVGFPPEEELRKLGDSQFVTTNAQPQTVPVTATVAQGYLEGSNVDAVEMMTEMMSAMRSYETAQRMALYQDQVLNQTVNEVGRVS